MNLFFIKEDGMIALETGLFIYKVGVQVEAPEYSLSFPDNVQLHIFW